MNGKHIARSLTIAALGLAAIGSPGDSAHAAVGRTEAAYGVTPNGGVSYSIPIRVTEGIGELTPKLAISHVGPGTRTVLGVGFALSGFSYITPCRKTIAQDLNAAPVTLTSADRFCLDGARLRLLSGTYGASNATYRTELDQLVRVTSLNSVSGIPGSFKVEMPNGLEYEYGNTTDSKLLASATSGAPPQFWAVNKISDGAGNSMSFVYDTNNSLRRFRPSYIEYTASNAGAGRYRVTFIYQTTVEATLLFTPSLAGGAAQSDDKLLDMIELSHDGIVYRKIDPEYETASNGNKRLQSVQECVPPFTSSDCLPPTTLAWQSSTAGHATTPVASNVASSSVIPLDINNDGFEDLVWASGGTWRYMLGSASGYGSIINTGVTITNPTKAMPLEWNADGFWDLLIDWSDGKWRVLKGSATGFVTPQVQAGPGTGIPSNAANTTWTIADADNDGRDDLLSMQYSTELTIIARFNSTTGFGGSTVVFSDANVHSKVKAFIRMNGASSIRRPDFNGDGRTDLLVYGCVWEPEPPGFCVFDRWFQLMSNGSTYVNEGPLASAALAIDANYADFNGDGLTDIVYPATTGVWNIGFGQGSGPLSIVAGPNSASYATYQTLTGDYDGDGYDDLYATRNSPWQWEVFLSTGSALTSTASSVGIAGTGLGWMLTDQTGDSLPDLGRFDSGSFIWSTYAHLGAPGERLTSSVDGLGNAVTFNYLPMSNSSVYVRGTGAVYPHRDYQSSLPLVSSMQVAPAGGTSFSMSYKYKNARVHAQGRSFLGMGIREITDGRNNVFTSEIYRQDFPYIGAPSSTTVKQSSAGNSIQNLTHTYANYVLDATSGNQRYLPYRSKTVTKAYEVGGLKNGLQITEITEDHTVNTLGNSTFMSVKVEDKDAGSAEYGSIWRTEVTSTFSEHQTDWCLALPLTRSEKRILPNATNETRAASWDVATASCRVTKETIAPGAGSTLSLVTDIGYDTCGNVDSVSSYPAGQSGLARTTSINYGTRCQRPESITNPENHGSSVAYNWPLALSSSHTDPNGITVGLVYDGFGRLTQRNHPDGTDVVFSLTACTAGNSWCGKDNTVRVKVSQSERNNVDTVIRTEEQFLDGFGRARWVHSDSLESGPAKVQTAFDAFGRASARSQPYFTGSTIYSTVYTRDLIGRVTQIDAPISEGQASGRITGFTFEGRDLKVTDAESNITTRRSNAIGQLRAVVDPSPGGTTNYAYYPFGEIASITDAANNITSWNYNQRGFVTGTTDPDSGSSTIETNAFGETQRIRDAKTVSPAWTTQFTYDKLSRPLTRIDLSPAGTTNFTWGTSAAAKNIGQLASISSPGNYSEVYSFDSLGRPSQQKVTADGTDYYFNLAYVSATGLLDTLEYPTSTSSYRLKLKYEYANGQLKRVKDANGATVFWEAVSTDAFGHIQDELFGNGVQTFTDFDQASGLMTLRQGGVGGGTGLINSETDWDLNGNLKLRRDLKLSPTVTEDFYYDSLNRFDFSQRNGATNADVTLDAIGNITWKQGVGNYAYHATKKRAVVTAGSNSYGYDAVGNMTSRNGSSITYTSYNLPSVINAPGGYSSTFSYGAFRNRFKQVAVGSAGTETTIYVAGLLEKVTRSGVTEYRHTIHGGKGTAAIYTRVSGGTNSTYYVHTDHLGSPELITSNSGTVLVRPSFGAYGERRDGTDWNGPPSGGDLTTIANLSRRGFTGHEHLDAVGLIHMNGRVYDPVAARFLGVDPIVQLGSSQSPNSYTYVWNNPLTNTDPSGLITLGPDMKSNCIECWNTYTPGEFWDAAAVFGWFENRSGIFGSASNRRPSQSASPAETRDGQSYAQRGVMYGAGAPIAGTATTISTIATLGIPELADKIFATSENSLEVSAKLTKWARIGLIGEMRALEYLVTRGYTIIGVGVYVKTSAGLRITDFLVVSPQSGRILGVEVKANGAVRNTLQKRKDHLLEIEGGIVVGTKNPLLPVGTAVKYETELLCVVVTSVPCEPFILDP